MHFEISAVDGTISTIKKHSPMKVGCFYHNNHYPNQLIYIVEFLVDGLYVNVYKFVFKDIDSIGDCDKLLLVEHVITDNISSIWTESAMGEFFPDENIRAILRAVRNGNRLNNTNLEANSWFEKAFQNYKDRRIAVEKISISNKEEPTTDNLVTSVILDTRHSIIELWYMINKHPLYNSRCHHLFDTLLTNFPNDRAMGVCFAKQYDLWDNTVCDPCKAIMELPGSTNAAICYAKQHGWWKTPISNIVYLKEDTTAETQTYDFPRHPICGNPVTLSQAWKNIEDAAKETENVEISIKDAWQCLSEAMARDFDWAWSVHCNLAMPIMDRTDCSHEKANIAAAQIMSHLFNYDVTGLKRYHDIFNRNSSESNNDSVTEDNTTKSVDTVISTPPASPHPCNAKKVDAVKRKIVEDSFIVGNYYSNSDYPNWLLLVTPSSLTFDNVVSFECIEVPSMNKLDNLVLNKDQIDMSKFVGVFATSAASSSAEDQPKDPFATAINGLCGSHRDIVANFKPDYYYRCNQMQQFSSRSGLGHLLGLSNLKLISHHLNGDISNNPQDIPKNSPGKLFSFFKPGVIYYNKNTGKFYRFCNARHAECLSFVFNLTTPNRKNLDEVVNIDFADIDLDDWSEADSDLNNIVQPTTASPSRIDDHLKSVDYQKLQKTQTFFKTNHVYKYKDNAEYLYIYREHHFTGNTVIIVFSLIKVFSDNSTVITGENVFTNFNTIDLNKWEAVDC